MLGSGQNNRLLTTLLKEPCADLRLPLPSCIGSAMLVVIVVALLLPSVLCQGGGMAELKSITGDEPYSGMGNNPPAPIPRPMGFWGRPRYAPVGYGAYMGGNPYYNPYGGRGRYPSMSYSPYEEPGQIPLGELLGNAALGNADVAPFSPYSHPSSFIRYSPTSASFQDSFAPGSINAALGSRTNTFTPPSIGVWTGSSGSVPLSEATGGGFYRGRGNDMAGR